MGSRKHISTTLLYCTMFELHRLANCITIFEFLLQHYVLMLNVYESLPTFIVSSSRFWTFVPFSPTNGGAKPEKEKARSS